MRRLAIHPRCFGAASLEQIAAALEETPVRAIELVWQDPSGGAAVTNAAPDWQIAAGVTNRQLQRLKSHIEALGLAIESVELTVTDGLSVETESELRSRLQRVADLGVSTVVGPADPGSVNADFEAACAVLERMVEAASDCGITYCVDTRPTFCTHPRGMLRLLAQVDHPGLRLGFDTGTLPYLNDQINLEIALAKVCHAVGYVRLRDSTGEYGRWDFPALGCGGSTDFTRVLQLLDVCRFQGPYVVAVDGLAGEPEPTFEQRVERVQESLRTLRFCGYLDQLPAPTEGSR